MNKHAGSTLTRLVGKPFSPINAGKSCLGGKGCLGYLRPYNEGLSAIPPHPIQQLPLVPQGRAYIGKGENFRTHQWLIVWVFSLVENLYCYLVQPETVREHMTFDNTDEHHHLHYCIYNSENYLVTISRLTFLTFFKCMKTL